MPSQSTNLFLPASERHAIRTLAIFDTINSSSISQRIITMHVSPSHALSVVHLLNDILLSTAKRFFHETRTIHCDARRVSMLSGENAYNEANAWKIDAGRSRNRSYPDSVESRSRRVVIKVFPQSYDDSRYSSIALDRQRNPPARIVAGKRVIDSQKVPISCMKR